MSSPQPPTSPGRKAIGIDLGTTFCAMAHIDAYGKPQIIPNSESERITPSVILFDGNSAIVGTLAKQNAVSEPEKIVDFVKREMGKSKAEFHREFNGKGYSAEELSAIIIKKLKNDAEKYLGQAITDAVITVPAYFNDSERTATLHAGSARRVERPPDHQRADRGRARVRARQAGLRPDGLRVRSRRRHLRRHDHAHRGPPHPHAGQQRRPPPRRQGLGRCHRQLGGGGIRQEPRREPAARLAELPGSLQPGRHREAAALRPHALHHRPQLQRPEREDRPHARGLSKAAAATCSRSARPSARSSCRRRR